MTTSHRERSLDHLAAVQAAKDVLHDVHTHRPHDRSAVAAGYDEIRQGLKLAEVHAVLAVAAELAALVEQGSKA